MVPVPVGAAGLSQFRLLEEGGGRRRAEATAIRAAPGPWPLLFGLRGRVVVPRV